MTLARRDLLGIASVAFAGSARADVPISTRTRLGEDPVPARLLPPGAESRFVTANGIGMHYVTAGSGPAVLLLHGWPETWFAWTGTIRALSDHFTLIAPDLRGRAGPSAQLQATTSGQSRRTCPTSSAGWPAAART